MMKNAESQVSFQEKHTRIYHMFFFLFYFRKMILFSGRTRVKVQIFFSQTGIPPSFFPLPRVLGEGCEPQSQWTISQWSRDVQTHTHTNPHPPCVSHWDILFRASSVVFTGADGTHYLCMLSAAWIFIAFIFRPISTATRVFSPKLFLPAACRDPHRATLQPSERTLM